MSPPGSLIGVKMPAQSSSAGEPPERPFPAASSRHAGKVYTHRADALNLTIQSLSSKRLRPSGTTSSCSMRCTRVRARRDTRFFRQAMLASRVPRATPG